MDVLPVRCSKSRISCVLTGIPSGYIYLSTLQSLFSEPVIGSIGCDVFSLFWNRDADPRRASLGASGALCAIMSFTACLSPKSTVLLYGLVPLPLWGCVVGIFLYDLYGSQRRTGTSSVSKHAPFS